MGMIFFWHLNRLEIELGSLFASIAMPQEEHKHKPWKQPIQGNTQCRRHVAHPSNETPKISARPIQKTRENLTLFDWMTVYTYVDTLPQPINQGEVVKHFATRPEHALLFTQSTLSRKLRQHSEMAARVDSHPNALSSKRIVARVQAKVDLARGVISEIDSDSDDDKPSTHVLCRCR